MSDTLPAKWCQPIADELRRIADDFAMADDAGGDLPEPRYVHLHLQPGGPKDSDDMVIAAVDALGLAIAGKPGQPELMSKGNYFYMVEIERGPVTFKVYREIEAKRARSILGEPEPDKTEEIARLRAQLAELEDGR